MKVNKEANEIRNQNMQKEKESYTHTQPNGLFEMQICLKRKGFSNVDQA